MDLATNEPRFEAHEAKPGEDRFIDLPDGRRLGYTEFGEPSGIPVFVFHGTPGSRFMFRIVDLVTSVYMNFPLAVQEMVFAVWLIAKGLNSSAAASGSARYEYGGNA